MEQAATVAVPVTVTVFRVKFKLPDSAYHAVKAARWPGDGMARAQYQPPKKKQISVTTGKLTRKLKLDHDDSQMTPRKRKSRPPRLNLNRAGDSNSPVGPRRFKFASRAAGYLDYIILVWPRFGPAAPSRTIGRAS